MDVKQVIVIRRDLKMRRGKECSQAAHAAMIWLTSRIRTKPNWIIRFFLWLFRRTAAIRLSTEEQEWIDGSFTKITLQVDSQDELLRYYTMAKSKGLTVSLVTDAGKTEFNGVPTFTAIAIGPHEASRIDEVTRSLKLY